MNDLHTTILQKASGETRINPDEQRLYMGTYRERVILVLSFDEANSNLLSQQFDAICHQLSTTYTPLFLKLSPSLSDHLHIKFMKSAQIYHITTTIIDEKLAQSLHALVFHTDHAIDKETIDLASVFPNLTENTEKKNDKKISFWKKLFG
ncbi:YueI family protein [Streptococcus suis]|nr:YueI family protein [Streptococcus suis]